MRSQNGFTLVELAIVLTIIALLIGGVLKGQEMITNARITSTIAQAKTYEAATKTFRDIYQDLPGDLPDADTRLKGTHTKAYAGGDGNGLVGAGKWAAVGYPAQAGQTGGEWDETIQYWGHLHFAGLISGISAPQPADEADMGPSRTHPRANLSGVFIAGYADGNDDNRLPGWPGSVAVDDITLNRGTVLLIVRDALEDPADDENRQPMTPSQVAQIDRRIDDGRPLTGLVQYYGRAGSSDTCMDASFNYGDNTRKKDCGVAFFFR